MSPQAQTAEDACASNAGRAASAAGKRTTVALTAMLSIALAALLSACSGGRDVALGDGQDRDPVTLDFPVFYVKRPAPDPEDAVVDDARSLRRFEIGADLYMRERASPSSHEINITGEITRGLGDVRHLDVSYDGTRVIFAMRAQFIEGAGEEDQPTWNLWEYDAASRTLRRLIQSDTTAEEGHDIMPHYLPDGRIVFSSTRQRQSRAILLDEGKPQFAGQDEDDNEPAFVLHAMNADGSDIHQISFNQSHDLDPTVLPNGRVMFARWEHNTDDNQFDLYTVNPDGSDLQLLYGAHSHNTGTVDPQTGQPGLIHFMNPRPTPDARTLAIIRPFAGTQEGGDLVLIDTENFVDNTTPASPDAGFSGPAQIRALGTDVRTIPGPSPGGRYASASPLFDGTGRLLVSWSQCRLIEDERIVPCTSDRLSNPQAVPAPPLYGVYVYDISKNTQLPVVAPQEGVLYTEVVAGSPRPPPSVILDRIPGVDFDAQLLAEGIGVVHIRSVYDLDGVDVAEGGIAAMRDPANAAYANRPARFLRIEKAVSQPDQATRDVPNTAFGPNRALGMRDIIGYAPIEPDGSVKVKVPANVAFGVSVLDARGRRLGSRHANWLQVTPGEQLECNGCHDPNGNPPRPHGRAGLTASVNAGAPTTGSAFPNTNAALFADMGETMAEVRSRIMCGGACEPSVDIASPVDYWPAASITPAAAFDMCYWKGASTIASDPMDPAARHTCSRGLSTPAPVQASCATSEWNSRCRITIHYPQHIHPLWSLDRFVDANGDGVADLDPLTGQPINHRCTRCHAPTDALGAPQVPAGQLDLTDGPSQDEPDQLKAYRELLFVDAAQELQGGALADRQVQVGVDPVTGRPQFEVVEVEPPMNAAGARASSRFFNKFETHSGSVDHRDFLSPSELRLLSEWLDIGAQYYNDPFAAPEN